jgi:hypothetical protein
MSWKCPSCGFQNLESFTNCECGYINDGEHPVEDEPMNCQDDSENGLRFPDFPVNYMSDHGSSLPELPETQELRPFRRHHSTSGGPHEELIKEIDSWLFSFSGVDNSISISTAALKSFRLKLTLEDLEDLLEFMYRKTGSEKTIRKVGLKPTDMVGLIDKVDRMIEEKKSKVSLNFTNDELREIADLVNIQIKAST